jgi:predicted amidohydrolase
MMIRVVGLELDRISLKEFEAQGGRNIEYQLKSENYDVLLLPEKWITDPLEAENPVVDFFLDLSRDSGSIIVPGSLSLKNGEGFSNSSPVIIDGRLVSWQHKMNPYRIERESMARGNALNIYNTKFGRISVAICYDIDFPYFAKISALNGVVLILNPSLIPAQFHREWHMYVESRALENRISMFSVNSSEEIFGGNSIAVWPYSDWIGVRIQTIHSDGKILRAEIDPDSFASIRKSRAEEDPGSYSLKEGSVNYF